MSLSVVSHTVVNFQTHRNTGSSTGLRKPRCIRLSRKSASASPRGARRMVVCMSEGPEITKKGQELSVDSLMGEETKAVKPDESFMVVGEGEFECLDCDYVYVPANGDPDYPLPKGMEFKDLPEDWRCPVCGAKKERFRFKGKVIAGFRQNQGYGFGTNSMTGAQKNVLIWGAFATVFLLLLSGYALQ